MSKLPSTINTAAMERRVRAAFFLWRGQSSRYVHTAFEHGHWWVGDNRTGGQWDAVDTDGGFDFEEVTPEDEES